MKRKESKDKSKKLMARDIKELVSTLKKQLGVEAVVFSGEHRGHVAIKLFDQEIGNTILFAGEDILTEKSVAILIAEDTFVKGIQEKVLESIQPGNKSIQ